MEPDLGGLMEVLGLDEEPMGMFYTDKDPGEAFSPRPQQLPSIEIEKKERLTGRLSSAISPASSGISGVPGERRPWLAVGLNPF